MEVGKTQAIDVDLEHGGLCRSIQGAAGFDQPAIRTAAIAANNAGKAVQVYKTAAICVYLEHVAPARTATSLGRPIQSVAGQNQFAVRFPSIVADRCKRIDVRITGAVGLDGEHRAIIGTRSEEHTSE